MNGERLHGSTIPGQDKLAIDALSDDFNFCT